MKNQQKPDALSRRRRALRTILRLIATWLIALLPVAVPGQWKSSGTLLVPEYSYSFLAASPKGDLLAATFNNSSAGGVPIPIPALLVRDPGSAAPSVVELCSLPFGGQRGYAGIATDPFGNLYVTGDTGEAMSCFLRKFTPEGAPDMSFGTGGELKPNRRCLGVDVLGQFVFLAVDWGEVMVLDASSGRTLGKVPTAPGNVFVRDIALDSRTMRIFGVAKGSVVSWQKGAPWSPAAYEFVPLTRAVGELRSGEGISLDAFKGAALITPIPGNTLLEISPDGKESRTVVETAAPDTHLADSVLSFDGLTLYVSDMKAKRIHILKRQFLGVVAPVPPTGAAGGGASPASPAPAADGAAPAPVPTWHRSYNKVLQQARESGKPMLVYFGRQDMPKCREFQNTILKSDDFNRRAQRFVCVYEDVGLDQLTAYRFGAYRVPSIFLLDRKGETVAQFIFDIKPDQLYAAMENMP